MKKKLLVCLLALALLVTAGAFAASAEGQAKTCPHCQKAMDQITWTAWSCTEGEIAGGHYYLERVFAQQTAMITVPEGVDVCLDLRGQAYFAQEIHPFDIYGTLTVMDSVGNGQFVTTGAQGMSGGFAKVKSSGTLNILSGAIRRIVRDDINLYAGGLVYVEGGTMKMSGGELRGGAVGSGVSSDKNTGAYGGNIYVKSSGRVEITGGLITGGTATVNHSGVNACGGNIYATGSSEVVISGGVVANGVNKSLLSGAYAYGGNIHATGSAKITVTGKAVIRDGMALRNGTQHAYGGNIYAESNAQLTVSGGSVCNGYSDEDGGNIYLAAASLTVSGNAAITGGHAVRHGGNIDLANVNAVLNMQGGTVSGGVAGGLLQNYGSTSQGSGGGGNIFSYKGTLTFANCTVAGDIRIGGETTAVTLSGVTKIGLGKSNGLGLPGGVDADVSGLQDGSEIFVSTIGDFTEAIPEADASRICNYFKGAIRTGIALNEETYALKATQGDTGYCPHCYDPQKPATVTWYIWGGSVDASKLHCYLTKNDNRVSSNSHISISQNLVLDLNGWSVNLNGRRVLMNTSNKTMVIMDSAGGGLMEGTGSGAANGGLLYMGANTSLTLLSGTLRRDPVTEVTNIVKCGGVIDAEGAGAKVSVQGGVISGGIVETEGSIGGGNIYINATNAKLTMSAGIIKNGSAAGTAGGNIYSKGVTTISGGFVIGGTAATGGSVYATGSTTLSGGAVCGGTADNGGNLYTTGSTTISGGAVYGGVAADNADTTEVNEGIGGNLYATGALAVSGGLIADGSARVGGNIYCQDLDMSDGVIFGGAATGNGGNAYLDAVAKTRSVSGGLIACGTAVKGGNIFVYGKSDVANNILSVSNGVIAGGIAGKMAGNVYVETNAKLSLSDTGVITGGMVTEASQHGGNVYVAGGTLDMTGGTISSGKATSRGGNLYTSATTSKLLISGGTVSGGYAANGGNVFLNNGTLQLSGSALITGGKATSYGGNVRIGGGTVTVTLSGGTISDGNATTGGGNFYTEKNATLSGTNFSGGRAGDGGSIYVGGGTLTLSGGEVADGYATSEGGNFYQSGSTALIKITGGTVKDGFAASAGGNITINNGCMTITGGTVKDGMAAKAGNIYLPLYVNGSVTIGGENNPTISGGRAYGGAGGNIYLVDQAHQNDSDSYTPHATAPWLAIGKCTITGGDAASFGDDIYVNQKAWIRFTEDFAGKTTVYFDNSHLPKGNPYGAQLDTDINQDNGAYTGTVLLENLTGAPALLSVDGYLQIASAALVKDGAYTWYGNNADLVTNYADSDYMRPEAGELTLAGGTYTVDLAGKTVHITGSGAVYGMDSANDTYDAALCGSATFDTEVTLAGIKAMEDDKTYFAVKNGESYTFHRGGLDITSVSLRPSNAGMYYSAIWQCDEILAAKIDAFGVAVSLAGVPGDDFVEKKNSLYTCQENFENGATGNGVLISGIVKTDRAELNSDYAQKLIHAAAYITMDGKNYTGKSESYSLRSLLQMLEDEIYDYYPYAEKLQSFMEQWDDYGLTGDSWQLDFTVPAEVVMLQNAYAGTTAYQGELHDHAATGGTSDGKYTLTQWLDGMQQLDMDFATIVDHKQYLHMELPEWDNQYFIGGTELAATVKGLSAASQNLVHINLVFYDPMDLKAAIEEYSEYGPGGGFNAQVYADDYAGENAEKLAGGWHYEYLFGNAAPSKENLAKLVEIVKKHNGVFVQVHPKGSKYIKSDDPLDYWFADWSGLEVFYTYNSHRDISTVTKKNYQLWVDLLKLGKKIWATAGNDEHAAPSDKAISTIYAPQQNAKDFVEQLGTGNFTAGPMGIRMVVGDSNGATAMGSECDFTGKQLAFSVGDFHRSVLDPTHTYKAVLIADEEVVEEWPISCEEEFYHYRAADASVGYYRVEIYDTTKDVLLGLGNPIWNTAAN